jgi:hypothetical protein
MLSLACAGAIVLSMVPARPAAAQETVFHVHKAGDTTSVANAVVTIDHVIEAGKTDAHGIVKVSDLEDGGHIVEITAPGYEYIFDQFDSGPAIKQPIELEVRVDKRQLNAVKGPTTGLQFAGFEGRRSKGVGTFLTRAQLDAASGRPLANVLSVDAKATFASDHGGDVLVSSDSPGSASSPCFSAVVRDGVRIYPVQGANPPNLGMLFAEQFAGVEFYGRATQVPAELKDAASCGALVLWSRGANK